MQMDLKCKRLGIFGLQGSGKTVFSKHILAKAERPFVVDPIREYDESDVGAGDIYRPKYTSYCPAAVSEINSVIRHVLESGPYDLLLIDEANRWCPSKRPLPAMVAKLNDEHRHVYNERGIALAYVARRPTQLHTDLAELAHYLVIFSLPGKNDRQYLNDVADGLGDAARAQEWHSYVVKDHRGLYTRQAPLQGVAE